ncbi:GntR family transcriptional regulator [Paraburkholderia fungorum]|jgi:DNA-binding GntR family transcriptional regulator|uniref:GntR family transcriptional regulator n=1 Tax=Paraburkholderia fungorum TaxID=134537 RepID=UPI0038B84C09
MNETATEELTPLYQQIRRKLREEIRSGERRAGERLPSEAEFAETYGTTRTTVRQALSQLVFEGLITQHSGRGSYVADRAPIHSTIDSRTCLTFEEQVALSGRTVTYGACTFAQVMAPADIAARLQIEPMSDVFHMERLRIIDGQPVCLEVRYLPHEIGLQVTGAMLARVPAHRFVSEILGVPVPTIVVSITAMIATEELAAKLDVAPGSALVVRQNTHHIESGKVVLCGRSLLRGDICTDYVLGRPLGGAGVPLSGAER